MQREPPGKTAQAEHVTGIRKAVRTGRHAQPQHPILQLQQTIGNRAVGQFLQAKLRVDRPDGADEREADRVADDVLAQSLDDEHSIRHRTIDRRVSLPIQAKPRDQGLAAPTLTGIADAVPAGGQPMAAPLSAMLERTFGHDFSDVRIHTGTRASQSAAAMNALAYTVGNDIVFGAGQFAPHTSAGKHLLAHELTHIVQQRQAEPRPQRKKSTAERPLLKVSAAGFDEAAQNFAAMIAQKSWIDKARIVVVNGPNIKVYDEKGVPVEKKFFHLQTPVTLPIGVFTRHGPGRQLHAINVDAGGQWGSAGAVALEQSVDFGKDIDDQEGFTKAITVHGYIYYVSPESTAVPPGADAPAPVPIENLPEFMEFEAKSKANLPAWPSDTVPLTPQIATVNSTGTFKCTVHKNQGYTTTDRVLNLMQPTSFRWEVLKLDEQFRVTSKKKTSGWDAAAEGFARRKRNIEDDRKAMIGDTRKQGAAKTLLKTALADKVSDTRMVLAMAGQTVMTVINAVAGGPNQLTTEDFMDVPFKEQGDFFVRCLATQIVPKDAKWRRATSVSGAMVSVYDIEDVAREALSSAEQQTAGAQASLGELEAAIKALDEEIAAGGPDADIKKSERDFKALSIDYLKDLSRAGSDPHDRKVAELNYIRSALAFYDSPSYPNDPKYADFKTAQIAGLKKREAELDADIKRMRTALQERDASITPVAYMPAVLVDEMTGAQMPLSFAIGERQYLAADELEVVIADVSSAKSRRIFNGSGGGSMGAGRHDAWLEAMDDLRKNLNRGRGYLSYEVPKAYEAWKSELPNPMQLQLSIGAQLKEMVDDTAHVLTLAAIMAAPFTGGSSLAILAVLAPIQAGSSLYNIVNRAAYNDLELDTEAIFDFINIATLGLGKISTAGKFASKSVQIVATSSRIAIRLLNYGQFILISFDTFQELMKEGDPNEDPRERRRRKLLKLLSWFEAAAIPVSEKLFTEAHGVGSKAAKERAEKRAEVFFDEPTVVLGKKKSRSISEGKFVEPPSRPAETLQPVEEGAPAREAPAEPKKTTPAGTAPAETTPAETTGPDKLPADSTAATDAQTKGGPAPAEPATFKPSRAQLKGVPRNLQGKVAVVEGMGRDARVVYKRGANGLITDVQIQIGEHTSAADVTAHVAIAGMIQKYAGLGGRLRRLLDKFANLFSGPEAQRPEIGSRAWEANLEMIKLDRMMQERHAELAKLAEQPAAERDAARMDELLDDLDVLESQFIEHAEVFNAIEMGTEQGRGYVAAEGLSEGDRIRRERRLPEAPDGYQWRYRKGELEVVVVKEGKPKLIYDETVKDFVPDTGARVPERFDVGIDRRKAFNDLGGYDDNTEFGTFVKMLKDEGLIESVKDVIKEMSDPSGRTHDTVRGNVKDIFKQRLIDHITNPTYLRKTARYKQVLKATHNKQQALRAAGMDEMLRITKPLGAQDRGSIAEKVYNELFGTGTGATHVDVSRAELAAAKGASEIEQGRSIDRVDGNTARELKNVTERLGPRERGQIADMLDMVGKKVQPSVGKPREIEQVAVAFLDPVGGAANASLAFELLSADPDAPLVFEFHTTDGKVLKVTAKNMDILQKSDFRTKLGLPPTDPEKNK